MNDYFIIFGSGFVLMAIVNYLLPLGKKRALVWKDKYYEPTERDYKVMSIFYLLLGMIMIFLGINMI